MQFGAIARLRHVLAAALRDYLDERGFLWVATPVLSGTDAEGAGERFQVTTSEPGAEETDPFFSQPAYLTVSGQLEAEAMCSALSRVYTFGPTFRAEKSHTTRHLAEFWMLEPEMAFADLDDIVRLAEGLLQHAVQACLTKLPAEMAYFADEGGQSVATWERFASESFVRMTYSEAIEKLSAATVDFSFLVAWGIDLQSEHEKWLVEQVGRPVILTDYPVGIKAFYMKQSPDGKTVAAMDILVPGVGEIVGGSVREESLDRLTERMTAAGMDLSAYEAYLDLRRYGSVLHGGFGLGFERLVAMMAGVPVRDAIAYPRTFGTLS
jgi:asparaginyl-tRNA synthetase